MPRWIPIDREDLAQERLLAELEGRCPEQATRAYIRSEHRYYDLVAPSSPEWESIRLASCPVAPLRPNRSAESIERRKAYTREWWRRNGAAYRKTRREASATSPANG